MPRMKKVDPYEIDFKFPYNSRELINNPDGTCKYDIPQLLAFAANAKTDYALSFVPSVQEQYAKQGALSPNQLYTLQNIADDYSPEWDDLNNKFFEWYDNRPGQQEMYKTCSVNSWWFYDRDGIHHSQEDARKLGWLERPAHWRMFQSIANSWEGSKFRELHRDVVYDIGDQVILRTPFIGSYRYDPAYGKADASVERLGMVVQHTEQISRKSRGGKGSRMINVLWISTGEQKPVPERMIKKFREKKA